MKLHLIRHAQTNANKSGQLLCIEEEPLNQIGIDQSFELKTYLSQLSFDEIWCSPLLRARQTIKPYEEDSGMVVVVEPLLREGNLNLNPKEKVNLSDFNHLETGQKESISMFRGRCMKLMKKIECLDDELTIVAITHGHFIREFLNLILDIGNYTRFPVHNISDTLIEFSEHPIIHYINRTH